MNETAAAQPAASAPPPVSAAASTLAAVDRRVSRLRLHIAAWRLAWGAECYLAVALTALACMAYVDQLARLDQETMRAFALWWWCAGGLVAILLVWRVCVLTPHRGQLALQLEARERSYSGHLLTAVEALERPDEVPPAVAEISGEHAWKVMQRMPLRAVCPALPWRNVHTGLIGALAFVFLGLGLFGFNYGRSLWDALFPGPSASVVAAQLRFRAIQPGNAEVEEGETLSVEVVCEGEVSGPLVLEVRDRRGQQPEDTQMDVQDDGSFSGRLVNLRKPCEYRVVAYGNASAVRRRAAALNSDWFSIALRPAHSFREVAVLVEPPEYTRRSPYWLRDPELVEAPVGSRMTLLTKAVPASGLDAGTAEVPGGQQIRMERLPDQTGVAQFRLQFSAERSGILRVGLNSRRADHPGVQTLLPISLLGDFPPEVVARIPDGAVAGRDGLPVNVKVRDDYGLSEARLMVRRLREGLEQSAEAAAETRFEIPLANGVRTMDEQWCIPAEGLDEWLALGFEYRLEARDNAPQSQTTQSDWARYEPLKRSQASGERDGLLDPPAKRRPRQLARSNALSRLPNPTPEELAQLKGLGDGVDAPRQLKRPQAERLDDGRSSAGQNASTQGQQDQPKQQDGDRYDLPQGLPKEKDPKPKDGAGGGAAQKDSPGDGEPDGQSEPKSGQRGSNDEDSGRKKEGPGDPQDGSRTAEGGEEEDPGGAVGASETQPGSGPGGRNERDGGPKTGREPGPGRGPMAPPDLETLARMKGFTPEEAAEYARKHRVVTAGEGFGARTGRSARSGETGIRQAMGQLSVKEPMRTAAGHGESGGKPDAQGVLRFSWDEIDPLYQPSVEGYFRRWQDWKGR